eukprot:Amastigsp_a174522_384.p1 type:complete len:281 gc:universal Amastigsp_a174522_384:865-23(-)
MRVSPQDVLNLIILYKPFAERSNVWELVTRAWNSSERNKDRQFNNAAEVTRVFMQYWVDFCSFSKGVHDAETRPVVPGTLRALNEYIEMRSNDPAWVAAMTFETAGDAGAAAGGAVPMVAEDAPDDDDDGEPEDNSLVGVWLRLLFSGSAFDMHGDVRLRCNQPGCDCLLYRHCASKRCAQCNHTYTSHAFGILSISRVLDSISDLVSQHKDLFWNLMLNQCTAFGESTELVAALEAEINAAETKKRKREDDGDGDGNDDENDGAGPAGSGAKKPRLEGE